MQLFQHTIYFLFAAAALINCRIEPVCAETGPPLPDSIDWQNWSPRIFSTARAEGRVVLLSLEAGWCHWCHVMDQQTYKDREVVRAVKAGFIAVKADQDSDPELGARYKEWGWPATIFFSPVGHELEKQAGYIEPAAMISLLTALSSGKTAQPPAPGPAAGQINSPADGRLPEQLRSVLIRKFEESFDPNEGGLITKHKFLDADSVEYALQRGLGADLQNARLWLHRNGLLLDAAWGGFYQYSTGGVWTNPHFEKIMSSQADNIRIYSQAAALLQDKSLTVPAEKTAAYLAEFLLSPEGAFYTSQDADLIPGVHSADYFALAREQRLKLGIPQINRQIYGRENGWAIEALVELQLATGNTEHFRQAQRAAEWIIANRSLAGGGFSHGEDKAGRPFLGDSLAIGRAALALYRASGERRWLDTALRAGKFITANFIEEGRPGFVSAAKAPDFPLDSFRSTAENISVVRYVNLLSHYSGDLELKQAAASGLAYLAQAETSSNSISEPGILMAADELARDPLHIAVVGPRRGKATRSLFQAAAAFPEIYKRVDLLDQADGPPLNPDLQYPPLKHPAAYVCTNKRCSMPIYAAEGIGPAVKMLRQR